MSKEKRRMLRHITNESRKIQRQETGHIFYFCKCSESAQSMLGELTQVPSPMILKIQSKNAVCSQVFLNVATVTYRHVTPTCDGDSVTNNV
jgi:hypothetical protein